MRERPPGVTDDEVLAAVREHWDSAATGIRHVPLGFGAHHWRVGGLFVTLDLPQHKHTAATLEATYAGAATLRESGLEFVHASLPTARGTFTTAFGGGSLSVTPWVDAPRAELPAGPEVLDRLHAATPPVGLRRWRPLVGPDLAEDLATRTARPWSQGPHGETARAALVQHLDDIAAWTATYHRHAAATDPATWVATHGEPHERNLLATSDGPLLVDWESLMLAPRERDLAHTGQPGDRGLLEMFDLEWRLDEVAQYATWFEGPHGDTENDRTALGGLRHELDRP